MLSGSAVGAETASDFRRMLRALLNCEMTWGLSFWAKEENA
jgi:hypothetical protein